MRGDLRGEAAGHLGHRGEQGQRAVGSFHGFVGEGDDLSLEQFASELLGGGQVQVGEQELALAHELVLRRERLLDLKDHVGLAPDIGGVLNDARADVSVGLVRDRRAFARARLDEHLVAAPHQLVDA